MQIAVDPGTNMAEGDRQNPVVHFQVIIHPAIHYPWHKGRGSFTAVAGVDPLST